MMGECKHNDLDVPYKCQSSETVARLWGRQYQKLSIDSMSHVGVNKSEQRHVLC